MRIAFGFDIFYPETNGVITATINLANNLIAMGHEVYFFVPKEHKFNENTIEKGIHIIHVKNVPAWIYKGLKLFPIQGWYLQKYFKKYHFDIVHNTSPWLMGQALNHTARRYHVPVVATHHTLIDQPTYIKYALKIDALANAATAIMDNRIFFICLFVLKSYFIRCLSGYCTVPSEEPASCHGVTWAKAWMVVALKVSVTVNACPAVLSLLPW